MKAENLFGKLNTGKFLISGPCVVESSEIMETIATELKGISEKLQIPVIFKASFDKANRTSISSYRGPGLEKGLQVLADIKAKFKLPILTDIHESWQAEVVAEVADVIQIPAFLCRQTDLLVAAAKTQKIVNIKKAQFLSGTDMQYPVQKVADTGNNMIMLTERGNMFGYNNLIVDFRNIVDMQSYGYPVIMDVTHSVQKPGGAGGKSGGNSEYIPYLAKAAAAVGAQGFFFETHPEPGKALSDGPNMIRLNELGKLVEEVFKL